MKAISYQLFYYSCGKNKKGGGINEEDRLLYVSSSGFGGNMGNYANLCNCRKYKNNATAYFANAEDNFTNAEFNEKTQNEAKNAAKSVLGSNIKLKTANVSFNGEIIVCYAKNIYMELDKESMRPVLYFYECEAGNEKYSEEECSRIAAQFVMKNAPVNIRAHTAQIELTSALGGTVSYLMDIGGKKAEIAVRRDTGSVVYYNGQAFF